MSERAIFTPEYDMRFLEAGLVDLEGYLLSKELYWPVGAGAPAGEPPYPRLTLGNLLLSRARLAARRLDPSQEARFERLNTRLEQTRSHWRTAWEQKAQNEVRIRLNLWRDFMEDYRQDPSENVDRYAYEVNRRVLLDLLDAEAGQIPSHEREMISGLDQLLRAVFIQGPFVWDADLEDGFPAGKFWYLYGRLKEKE